jgi:hypothetical protein
MFSPSGGQTELSADMECRPPREFDSFPRRSFQRIAVTAQCFSIGFSNGLVCGLT